MISVEYSYILVELIITHYNTVNIISASIIQYRQRVDRVVLQYMTQIILCNISLL